MIVSTQRRHRVNHGAGDWMVARTDRLVNVAADLMKNEAGLLVTRNGEPAAPSEDVRLPAFLSRATSRLSTSWPDHEPNRLFEPR
ncbi:hypothetical protein [Stutzerimonas xanthomarina]|uniref:hypothetical protein n=1 Tax=Stutzerimonas xanthomarina TaxID=271420 RepID=UPI003AA8B365